MKILFGVRSDGADAWFRAVGPASVMRYNGLEVEARAVSADDAEEYDVLVLQRHCDLAAAFILNEFREKGKPVIYDVDDYLFQIPPSWDCYGEYRYRGYGTPTPLLARHQWMLEQADMVTCSTPALADKLGQYNGRVRVVPNCILWADWDPLLPAEKKPDKPVIGWFGLPYHWDAWKAITPAVEEAVLSADAVLAIIGFPEVVQLFSEELRARTLVQPMVPWRDFGAVRRMIATFDVGIAWAEDTPFYNCKSPLRALQYGAAGVPIVASHTVYGELLESDEEYGHVAHTPNELCCYLQDVLGHDWEASVAAASEWKQEVFRHHSMETQWRAWADVIEEVTAI